MALASHKLTNQTNSSNKTAAKQQCCLHALVMQGKFATAPPSILGGSWGCCGTHLHMMILQEQSSADFIPYFCFFLFPPFLSPFLLLLLTLSPSFSNLPFPSQSRLLQAFPMPVSEASVGSEGFWAVEGVASAAANSDSFTVLISHIHTSSGYPQLPRKVSDYLLMRNGALSGEYLLWGMSSAGRNSVVDLFCAHANSHRCTSWRIQSRNAVFLVRRGFMCSVAPLPMPHPTSALFSVTQGAQPANWPVFVRPLTELHLLYQRPMGAVLSPQLSR